MITLQQTNMNKKEKKKALRRLYGRNMPYEIMLFITIVVQLCVVDFVLSITYHFNILKEDALYVMIPFLAFMIELLYIVFLLLNHYRHCALLKEKYEELPSYQKEELLQLAHGYKRNQGICFNENFIYGLLTESIGKGKAVYVNTFLYVDLSEISWLYKISTSVATWSQYGAAASSIIRTPQDDQIKFYTYNGKHYHGKKSYTDMNKLFSLLHEKSPACKLGYRKDWEALYK